jgi:parallel beta-helix repeat protein
MSRVTVLAVLLSLTAPVLARDSRPTPKPAGIEAAFIRLLLFFLLLCASPAIAAEYYVTPDGGGDGTGSEEANALSYAALFSKPLAKGDRVRLEAGRVYSGQLWPKAGVTYGRYGEGANPIISGFTTLSGWTRSGGNVYYAPLAGKRYHGVTLDGVVQRMGRHPNAGYLAYKGTNAVQDNPSTPQNDFVLATHITGETIGALPFNALGAEVCIRKFRWVIDRHIVTAHAGDTLEFSSTKFYGNNAAYNPQAGNGYFIQGHLGTLDEEGEWWFDAENGRLYMHFGTGMPEGRVVKVSTLDQVVPINSSADIAFSAIDFEGGNTAIVIQGSKNITIRGCNFRQQGTSAVHGNQATDVTITGGSITGALNGGIEFPIGASGVTIERLKVTDTAVIAGAGYSGDGGYNAIFVVGSGTTVRNCVVTNTGYSGIHFIGDRVRVEENHVERFCTVKDDGAGIYTYLGSNTEGAETVIRKNVVLHAVGAFAGSESFSYESYGKAAGIYLDGYANHVTVDGNVVAHGAWGGVFLNGNRHNRITNNLVYDFSSQFLIHAHTAAGMVRDHTVTGNLFIARTAAQSTVEVNLYVKDDIRLFGAFDRNVFARPVSEGATIRINWALAGGNGSSPMDLAAWKNAFKLDPASTASAVVADKPESLRFEYTTADAASVPLKGSWKDVSGTRYSGHLTLEPYSGRVIIPSKTTRTDLEP